ncbi:MAG: hypothetical protein IKG90_08025 [Bacteroidales bacterium]|nr:hypothetical protein [Bacteroidales bacterium]MBR6882237.1 hypothetical protein [Bacteroidales bacterium]
MKSAEDAIREFPEIAKQLADIDRTPDKRYLYRICQMYVNHEATIKELKSLFIERAAIFQYLTNDDVDGKDIHELSLENEKGSFRKGLYSTDEQLLDWRNTVVYEDEFTTVNKPSTFQESRSIGYPQWCFCYNNDKWIQHNEIEHETIYFVHSVTVPKQWEYNAVCVLPNGDKKVIDYNHEYLSRQNGELFGYLREINNATKVLISDKVNNESKTNKNMKKNTIKLNESQLRKIVAESVKRVLNEYAEGNEISPVPGDNYNPTPKSLIETIINEMQHIKTLCENTFQSIVHSDIGNARKGLSEMNQSLDVALDRANELQGFIDYNDNENY